MRFPLGRRGFLAAGAASLGALAVNGCGDSGGGEPRSDRSDTPVRGGRLRAAFAGGGASENLDPHLANLFGDVARAKAQYDKLADYGPNLAAVPRLAAKWEPNKTLDRWQVTLREAEFHDGRPVTAQDVLYSYRRIADPAKAFRAKASLEPIDLAVSRATGTRTIEFVLKRPTAEFANVLAAFGAYIVPDKATDFDKKPVGSGPFRFVSFAPGRSAVFRRNDSYWEGAPHLDELEFVVANEESARVNALLGGQIEYAHELNPTTARAHEGRGQIEIVRLRGSAMQAFAMKTDRPPFDDPRVRQAFFLIADRQELVDGALSGAGVVGNDLFGKGYEYYAADLPQRAQDLAKARALLKAAGASDLKVTLDTSEVAAGFTEAAGIFRDQAKKAGVTVEVRVGSKDSYWSDILDSGVLACYRSGAMPIEAHISQRLLTDSTTNATHWRHKDFDALYRQAQSTSDATERAAVYGRMQRRLYTEGGFLVWGFADWIIGTGRQVKGVEKAAPANTLGWARFDKVWLA
ncbi:ABC transporter substrate-binding protein [Streptomyces acidiscabies]|uniref:ABC transporter substrate-binding protein n=1 Tax=Streptomyces acidiscabies TaxID=42234 RepID=A0AAP6B5I8_9ACTN|nr:ABC transporter substrate-binding protein [Streptomyces acidiscabies]MBP5941665.1 ABC transporter substrate-binding protein [Streptomyces sp. LBUM 1476]MBZ3913070.1 ABC transporter substrate-binding protein [Streptomyces acidiscabies]MDX2958557.1 ABC transporter substrate-binding protein [Streptomyces acidiscabies]MDX3020937.1 ABC transporter substrate-binding protein [Streptomyces acidiscabies]MDX3790034.1 ABC transporter substrate-binding protein [Streptomyces acidiscabies]